MTFREALEIYLIGPMAEDIENDVINEICGNFRCDPTVSEDEHVGNLESRVLSQKAKISPDFIDDNGVKRLRIKTLVSITGLGAYDIIFNAKEGLDPRFIDAMDFMSLNKQTFLDGTAKDNKPFIEAHAALVDYGPPEVAKMFEDKFTEVFGETPFDYVDEKGDKYISSQKLADFFDVPVAEVEGGMKDVIGLGHAKVVPMFPDPEDGIIH